MARKNQSISQLISNQQAFIEDQFQNLRETVNQKREKDPGLVSILVTAESHGDGASMVAINLALSLIKEGKKKVVLVDADRRNPILNAAFDLGDVQGLAEVLSGKAALENVIHTTLEPPKVSIVPYGLDIEKSPLFGKQKMAETLARLKDSFDFAIFNSSPVNKYSDTAALAAHLDAAILVMRAEATKWDGLERAKIRLEKAGIPILGVVMNRRRYYIPRFLFKRLFV